MNTRTLRVAQIGCGAFAASQDLPNFQRHPQVECVWCCDVNEDNARRLAQSFDVARVTTDFRDVMNDPDVDFVKLSTSHEAHLPLIEAAAQAGKHVFCEKPLALDETEAFKIIRAVRGGGIKLCVDFNRRMAPALQALKRRWEEQRREPRFQPWRYFEGERELFPEEKTSQFLVRVQDESIAYRLVHLDPLRGGGLIIGESVHWLDLACWLFASQVPTEIQAWGSARLSHGIHLTFSGGDTATIIFNCGGTFDYPKELFEITSHGALFRDKHFVENNYYGIPGAERETFALQHDSMPEIGTEGGYAGYVNKYETRVRGLSNSKEGFSELSVNKGHAEMLDGFVHAILHDTPSPCDETAGYLATYLARLAIKSIELRQALPVPIDRVVLSLV